MKPARRLLARLASPRPAHPADAAARLAAIVDHLGALLNTRAGSSLLDPTYGLPDLTDHAHATCDRSAAIARLVEASVRAHEPRLAGVVVRAEAPSDDAPACVRFALSAALSDGSPLQLRGHIGRGGRVELQRHAG